MSAADLMAQLAQDRDFQEATAARESELRERVRAYRAAERPIVADLRSAGVEVDSVWDLVNTSDPYPEALPVLLEHLERGGYPDRVMAGLARALAVKPAVTMWDRLRELYLRAVGPEERESLAAALAGSAGPEQLDSMVGLLGEESRGDTRIHFLRPILRGGPAGRRVVEGLRDDPVFGQEATALLRHEPRR